jgi:hypothetical protein
LSRLGFWQVGKIKAVALLGQDRGAIMGSKDKQKNLQLAWTAEAADF